MKHKWLIAISTVCLIFLAKCGYDLTRFFRAQSHSLLNYKIDQMAVRLESFRLEADDNKFPIFLPPQWDAVVTDKVQRMVQDWNMCDVWNTPFKYELIGDGFKITSAGPDKKFGTRDDIAKTFTNGAAHRLFEKMFGVGAYADIVITNTTSVPCDSVTPLSPPQ